MEEFVILWHDWRLPLFLIAFAIFTIVHIWRRSGHQDTNISKPVVRNVDSLEKQGGTNTVEEAVVSLPQVQTLLNRPDVVARPQTPKRANTQPTPKRIIGRKPTSIKRTSSPQNNETPTIQPLVFYSSLSGTTKQAAVQLTEQLCASFSTTRTISKSCIHDLSEIDHDDYFTSLPKTSPNEPPVLYFYILLLPTYNIDTDLDLFISHLRETHHDFRVDTSPLSGMLGYTVFGFGDKQDWPTEAEGYCSQAQEVDKWMARLSGGKRAYPLGMGDVSSDALERLEEWRKGLEEILKDLGDGKTLGEGVTGSGDAIESDDEDEDVQIPGTTRPKKAQTTSETFDDMENLGASVELSSTAIRTDSSSTPLAIDFTTYTPGPTIPVPPSSTTFTPKEMVPINSPTYNSLTKQGYTIVGSHSGVKICRWTKSALRGRGSCYKFSFYGIKSHLCMETTPSLSCSNKCVFCWRHGTNPVGTTWRWQVDPPEAIFAGVKEGHYKKIKMLRGVPGVRAERFEEAMRIKHCALSLVGEPIFYPYINEFVALLHAERISSFLVCNAQHPAQLAALKTVTQLYVSIDASNRDSLRRIDRPLHRDFWERLLACLDILRERRHRQRTVFRLTLVKGFNISDEAEGYADLIARGLPCFVEVKGVTYCGTSTSSSAGLTMQNVPFYSEVSAFVLELEAALLRRGLDYGIAAEHAHSCCILIGSKRFLKEGGVWHTVIDYERFFELLEGGGEFGPEDYTRPTSEWAYWGKGGFDPMDERVVRRRGKVVGVVGKADGVEVEVGGKADVVEIGI